ncbi:MAG TPA: acyltransferase [Burkholderiales bacterium]|jgi:peptidoglycan/LPS O-acetylase OafA/YrhL|nr:acyltransferase [Burkholderiales bacterium]
MPGYDAYRGTRVFASLDGLRCLSILAVIWHHCGWQAAPWEVLHMGYRGVDLFFVISGFLITTLLLREREETGGVSLREFWMRRALRIFPLYYTVVALYALTVFLFERHSPAGQAFFGNLPFFLTYTSNWFIQLDGRVIFYFAWSLATEQQFYLVWPAIEKALGAMAIPLVVGSILLVRQAVEAWAPDSPWATMIVSIHPAILGGVLLAHVLHDPQGYAIAAKTMAQKWFGPAALVAVLVALSLDQRWMIWASMTLLVGAAVAREDHLLTFLRWRPLVYLGTISYGMYLLHLLCHNVVKRALPGLELLWLPATIALTVLVAGLSFRYYESYFLRLKKRFQWSERTARVRRDSAGARLSSPKTVRA